MAESGVVTPPARARAASVLIVEDEEMLRGLAVRALAQAGFEVSVAANGQEGLAAAMAHRGSLDLVITDVIMPELGGREMARQLAGVRPGVPVLFTSGYTGDAGLVEWLKASGAAFLPKPYTPAELVKAASALIAPARDTPPSS